METVYEYDDAGRVISAVTSSEPEFTPTEVALLLAARARDRETGPHGVPMDIATDPSMRDRIRVDATVDFVAQKIAQTRKSYEQDYQHQDLSGVFFSASMTAD